MSHAGPDRRRAGRARRRHRARGRPLAVDLRSRPLEVDTKSTAHRPRDRRRPGRRGADRRAHHGGPPRRRRSSARRGRQRRRRDDAEVALGRRSDRRHDQLRLRPPGLGGVDRRRGRRRPDVGRRGRRPAATATSSSAVAGPGATRNGAPLAIGDPPAAGRGAGRHRVRLRPRAPGAAGRRRSTASCPGSATSDGWAPRRSTCARSRSAGSTPTTSAGWRPWDLAAGRADRDRGRRPRRASSTAVRRSPAAIVLAAHPALWDDARGAPRSSSGR